MISLREAVERGVTRLRRPQWLHPEDHLEIAIVDGRRAPWVKLWSPKNAVIGLDNPKEFLMIDVDNEAQVYEPYEGPLPDL